MITVFAELIFILLAGLRNYPLLLKGMVFQVKTYGKIPMKDKYRLIWGQSNLAGLEDLAADSTVIGVEKAEESPEMDGHDGSAERPSLRRVSPWIPLGYA